MNEWKYLEIDNLPPDIDLASQNLSLASGLSKKQATALIKAVIFAYGKESAIELPEEAS